MGFTSAFNSWTDGNWTEGFNFLLIPEAAIEGDRAATQGLVASAQDLYLRGVITQAEMQKRVNQITLDGNYTERFKDPNLSPSLGFAEGLQEGVNDIKGALNSATGFTLAAIPWQIWAVLGVAGALYLLPLLLSLRRQ